MGFPMKHLFLVFPALAVMLSAAAPTACAQEAQTRDVRISVPYERFVLPNGLNVILHEDHSIPVVSVNMYYNVGSANEKPGRTGFAHLFEHLMFEGSGHVAEGKFDQWLEAAGGSNNGSTNTDRTNYWENVPSHALDLALFLESDRLGYLLDDMTQDKLDGQRAVVKNERRQSYENRPYGMASIVLGEHLYPAEHPYHWPTIGSMEDISAASFEDVADFFRTYYIPNNASLVVAGDIDIEEAKQRVTYWFGEIPAGKPIPLIDAPPVRLEAEDRLLLEDKVQLPRLYMAWLTPPFYHPGDAELDILSSVLSSGKNSRLYKRLVYELQIAQSVYSYQASSSLSSEFYIVATARPGHTLAELETVIQQELDRIKKAPPSQREMLRAVNGYEAQFLGRLERVGGFGGKADLLNGYYIRTGNPDYFNEALSRYRALDATDISATAQTWLRDNARVVLSVVPNGKKELASMKERK